MGYRNPAFYLWHEFAEADDVTTFGATPDTSVDLVRDYRQEELHEVPTVTDPTLYQVIADRGAYGGGFHSLDTVILPAGASYSGNTGYRVMIATASDFVTEEVLVNVAGPLDDSLIVQSFTATNDLTYGWARILWNPDGSGSDINIGEVYLTEKREMSRGPDPGWDISSRSHSTNAVSMAGVESSRITGPSLSTFRLRFNSLGVADMAIIDELLTLCGTARPFYFTPPDDRYPEVMLCKLSRDPQAKQKRQVPSVSIEYDVQLDLIEVAG